MAACGTPKPRKAPAGGPLVKKASPQVRTLGHGIGPHGMDRHAIGDGRPPRGIGAGIEGRRHVAGQELALGIAAEPGARCARDGAWCWPPCFPAACRRRRTGRLELPGRQRHQRLQREVELAAEAAAAGGRHDAHRLGPEPHHVRDLVAVHVGRLGGGDGSRCDRPPAGPSPPRARYRRARRRPVSNTPSATAAQAGEGRRRHRRAARRHPAGDSSGLSACTSGASGGGRRVDARTPAARASRRSAPPRRAMASTAARSPTSATTASPR